MTEKTENQQELGNSELKSVPTEAEIDELLHYFQAIASPMARRKVIASARLASSADPKPSGE